LPKSIDGEGYNDTIEKEPSRKIKTGGPLEKLGIPTHVHSVQDKIDRKAGRPPQSIFVDMNNVPFTLDIDQKLHEERSQHQEEDEEL
jgi:hypothetical protein